ncbi:MAG: hypothetical protein HY069_01610 [Chlamydiia bacterium]|nr:hypothetical protein [Chlamydiia bacterium]
MLRHRSFLLTAVLLFALTGMALMRPQAQKEVEQIDQQIEQLQDKKRGYEARALRHEDYIQRLQFDDRAYLEMRRHGQLADENRARAAQMQEEIDRLQAKKQQILEKEKRAGRV